MSVNRIRRSLHLLPLVGADQLTLGQHVPRHRVQQLFLVQAGQDVKCGVECVDLEVIMMRAVSSWRRPDDNVTPPQIKSTGIYINNALAKSEAVLNGFDEAIMLTPDGHVSEGSGENIFLVIDGKLVTPATYNNILNGITRDTIIRLAQEELGIETIERAVDRSELYTAAECFLTGTAANVTPVAEIDRRTIGNGEIGPVTDRLMSIYAQVIRGMHPKYRDWCTPVYPR